MKNLFDSLHCLYHDIFNKSWNRRHIYGPFHLLHDEAFTHIFYYKEVSWLKSEANSTTIKLRDFISFFVWDLSRGTAFPIGFCQSVSHTFSQTWENMGFWRFVYLSEAYRAMRSCWYIVRQIKTVLFPLKTLPEIVYLRVLCQFLSFPTCLFFFFGGGWSIRSDSF